jgi:mono/diheme cytochrome c family protein
MEKHLVLRQLGWVVAALGSVGAMACGTPAPSDTGTHAALKNATTTQDAGAATTGALSFLPKKSYTGFDGSHSFEVPVIVHNSSSDLTVTADDPSAVEISPAKLAPLGPGAAKSGGKYFMVKAKKAGVHTLTAKSNGDEKQIVLTVSSYEGAQLAAGQARYASAGASGDPPCVQCHGNGQNDHSPSALSGYSDSTVGKVITSGVLPTGLPITISGQPGHRWTASTDERKAVVAYLRSLQPLGFQ